MSGSDTRTARAWTPLAAALALAAPVALSAAPLPAPHALVAATLPAAQQPAPQQAGQDAAAPRPLEVDDLFRIRGVGSPSVSPDGRWVAYTVSTTSLEDEDRSTRLWMAPVDAAGEGAPRALPLSLESGSVSSPAWSPDGRYISFTASRGEDAETQVWVLDRRGGEAQQLTDVKQGVGGYAWSPDASRLVL